MLFVWDGMMEVRHADIYSNPNTVNLIAWYLPSPHGVVTSQGQPLILIEFFGRAIERDDAVRQGGHGNGGHGNGTHGRRRRRRRRRQMPEIEGYGNETRET